MGKVVKLDGPVRGRSGAGAAGRPRASRGSAWAANASSWLLPYRVMGNTSFRAGRGSLGAR
jgi:hypothetical protein